MMYKNILRYCMRTLLKLEHSVNISERTFVRIAFNRFNMAGNLCLALMSHMYSDVIYLC